MDVKKEAELITGMAMVLTLVGAMSHKDPKVIQQDILELVMPEMERFRTACREEVLNEIQDTNRALADALQFSGDRKREKE